jgi:SAM-dependent methyltransferase
MSVVAPVNYSHTGNLHTLQGAVTAFSVIFGSSMPGSVLDVGAGTGTWLRAASDFGVKDFLGVDGIIPEQHLHIPKEKIQLQNLTRPFDLGRKFDVALSLEVAEHLPEPAAETIIASITRHADTVLFSAAAPGQGGDHHINCQWPTFWQTLFNKNGFACEDSVRWKIWNEPRIEPWYRQNMFWARRDSRAGSEPRINAVIHPDMRMFMSGEPVRNAIDQIEQGTYPFSWYVTVPFQATINKLVRRLGQS